VAARQLARLGVVQRLDECAVKAQGRESSRLPLQRAQRAGRQLVVHLHGVQRHSGVVINLQVVLRGGGAQHCEGRIRALERLAQREASLRGEPRRRALVRSCKHNNATRQRGVQQRGRGRGRGVRKRHGALLRAA
jgi:hypothetical protein